MTEPPHSPLLEELDALGTWKLERPPADFADRVLAQAHAEPGAAAAAPRRRSTKWTIAAVAAAAVLSAFATYAIVRPNPGTPFPAHGEVETTARRSLNIHERAVVVAEAGARLAWDVAADGSARVRQGRGEAFYRVAPGKSFEVATPAGLVRVTGTCFTVEVKEMKRSRSLIKGGALGAALAAAAVVTVYEGEVVLANDKGAVTVKPGDRATARKGERPTRDEARSDSTTLSALKAQNKANRRELARLRRELAERDSGSPSEPEPGASADSTEEPERLMSGGPIKPEGFSYFEPTQAALEQMADCGIVAWDNPPVFTDGGFDDAWRETAGVEPQEGTSIEEAVAAFRETSKTKLRDFYVELGGDPETADSFSARELIQLTYARVDMEELVATREAIAREKAGREKPPETPSVTGRFMRWEADLGNDFESELASRLDPARARELRASANGWGSNRLTYTNLCAD